MQIKKSNLNLLFSSVLKSLLFAVLITIAVGYLTGYKVILVNGWSAEPFIKYKSLIVTYHCGEAELNLGDFVTFSYSGNAYITHQITDIDSSTGTITCQGWNYDNELKEYRLQSDKQTLKYQNIAGKVIYSSEFLGSNIFALKQNPFLLILLVAGLILTVTLKSQLNTKSQYYMAG